MAGPTSGGTSGKRPRVGVGLHGEDDEVRGPDAGRVGLGADRDGELPGRAADAHASRADRLEVGAPRDQRHVVAGLRQPRAVVASDRSRSDDCDLHVHAREVSCAMAVVAKNLTVVRGFLPEPPCSLTTAHSAVPSTVEGVSFVTIMVHWLLPFS